MAVTEALQAGGDIVGTNCGNGMKRMMIEIIVQTRAVEKYYARP